MTDLQIKALKKANALIDQGAKEFEIARLQALKEEPSTHISGSVDTACNASRDLTEAITWIKAVLKEV